METKCTQFPREGSLKKTIREEKSGPRERDF